MSTIKARIIPDGENYYVVEELSMEHTYAFESDPTTFMIIDSSIPVGSIISPSGTLISPPVPPADIVVPSEDTGNPFNTFDVPPSIITVINNTATMTIQAFQEEIDRCNVILGWANDEVQRRSTKINQLQAGDPNVVIQPHVLNFPYVPEAVPFGVVFTTTVITGDYELRYPIRDEDPPKGHEPVNPAYHPFAGETLIADHPDVGFTNTNLISLDTSSRIAYLQGMLNHHIQIQTMYRERIDGLQSIINTLSTTTSTQVFIG